MVRWQTPGRPTLFVLVALAAIVVAGVILNIWGIVGDLPYAPDVDEPVILQAAVHAIHHRLDPAWFGHPGSTLVYPTAALIELWYLVARHVPPFAHAMPGIARELIVDPTPFYLIGRLVAAAYGVAALVATWLLARRFVGDLGGLLAAAIVLTTSIVVLYGHLVRTDTPGLFFALLALWLMLRAIEHGRWRDWILAAVAIGLAVSTRYFYATLIVPYAVAAVLWLRTAPARPGATRAWHVPVVATLAVPVTFAITSPYVLLRLPQVIDDLRFEAQGDHPGADGLSFFGNLRWYLADALPANVNLVLLILAIVGFVILARAQPRSTAVLAAFAASYLLGVSAAPLHWDRYVIPLVPLVGIGVAATVLTFADLVVSWVSRWRAGGASTTSPATGDAGAGGPIARGPAATVIAVLIVGVLVLPSVVAIADADRLRAVPSTRAAASDWIRDNLPPDSRIAAEMYTLYGAAQDPDVLRVSSLGDRPLSAYHADGYRYLLWSSAMADRFVDAARYPEQHALYTALEASGRPLATFAPGSDRAGPEIRVYEIAGS